MVRITAIFLVTLLWLWPVYSSKYVHNDFIDCLSQNVEGSSGISRVVYTPNNSSYSSILTSSIRNLRFTTGTEPKPQVIVTPVEESQIPAVVLCAKANGLQIRTRSGGHDYEGLSYISNVPFIILDLFLMNDISVDNKTKTAWVQTGATNGQMYFKIFNTNRRLGFPAGGCPTVGVGGLFSGGGYGSMLRKHGLAADNIIDARIVDVNGRILDREGMGEDLFWAIRGGGGASFGVITAWRIRLVDMPDIVTVFLVQRTVEQNCTDLINRWQNVSPSLPKDIILSVIVQAVNVNGTDTIQASFTSLYLGRMDPLLKLIGERFPELRLSREECQEVRWIQASLLYGGYTTDQPVQILTSRNPEIPSAIQATTSSFKAKIDYVQKPIPRYAFEGMWNLLLKRAPGTSQLLLIPYGGRMSEISESAIPFPHRAGNLYKIQELVYWNHSGVSKKSLKWVRSFYAYMTPFVSKNPRQGYINYRDNDLGVNDEKGNTSYAKAKVWGEKYFMTNFRRLAEIKTRVDPANYFRNEQSIPILKNKWEDIQLGEGTANTAAAM